MHLSSIFYDIFSPKKKKEKDIIDHKYLTLFAKGFFSSVNNEKLVGANYINFL